MARPSMKETPAIVKLGYSFRCVREDGALAGLQITHNGIDVLGEYFPRGEQATIDMHERIKQLRNATPRTPHVSRGLYPGRYSTREV